MSFRSDPEVRRAYHRKYYERRRLQAVESLGGKCVVCGSTENLEFDHKDPTSKTVAVSELFKSSQELIDLELAKCQLLCHSCHIEKSRRGSEFQAKKAIKHGTEYAYSGRKCRCDVCKNGRRIRRLKTR